MSKEIIELKDRIVQWIRNWFVENGCGCKAVIGISGGKDSTIAAALCVEALGADRVVGVMMPNGIQSDLNDSVAVCKHLGIPGLTINIEPPVSKILNSLVYEGHDVMTEEYKKVILKVSEQTKINLPPRIRMAVLYAVSQSVNGRVVNTCNLSEEYIGYSTRWGDSVGDFSPFALLTSDEVIAIGDIMNLPKELVHKTPSDGLCGKTDEDNFGFTYDQLNTYIRRGICDDASVCDKIQQLHKKNEFKLKPIPCYPHDGVVYDPRKS